MVEQRRRWQVRRHRALDDIQATFVKVDARTGAGSVRIRKIEFVAVDAIGVRECEVRDLGALLDELERRMDDGSTHIAPGVVVAKIAVPAGGFACFHSLIF